MPAPYCLFSLPIFAVTLPPIRLLRDVTRRYAAMLIAAMRDYARCYATPLIIAAAPLVTLRDAALCLRHYAADIAEVKMISADAADVLDSC